MIPRLGSLVLVISVIPTEQGVAQTLSSQFEVEIAHEGGMGKLQVRVPGWLEGEAAANQRGIGGRPVLGGLGGLFLVVWVVGLASEEVDGSVGPLVVGGAALGLAGFSGSTMPRRETLNALAGSDPAYRFAFLDAYAGRLSVRRRRGAFIGAAVGAVFTIAVLSLSGV